MADAAVEIDEFSQSLGELFGHLQASEGTLERRTRVLERALQHSHNEQASLWAELRKVHGREKQAQHVIQALTERVEALERNTRSQCPRQGPAGNVDENSGSDEHNENWFTVIEERLKRIEQRQARTNGIGSLEKVVDRTPASALETIPKLVESYLTTPIEGAHQMVLEQARLELDDVTAKVKSDARALLRQLSEQTNDDIEHLSRRMTLLRDELARVQGRKADRMTVSNEVRLCRCPDLLACCCMTASISGHTNRRIARS